ncbi:BON domain-containing protein [Mycolicibacterium sp. HS_4_1]
MRDRIRTELTRTLDRELNHIDIQASDGDVTLSGTVQSLSEAAAARRAARANWSAAACISLWPEPILRSAPAWREAACGRGRDIAPDQLDGHTATEQTRSEGVVQDATAEPERPAQKSR